MKAIQKAIQLNLLQVWNQIHSSLWTITLRTAPYMVCVISTNIIGLKSNLHVSGYFNIYLNWRYCYNLYHFLEPGGSSHSQQLPVVVHFLYWTFTSNGKSILFIWRSDRSQPSSGKSHIQLWPFVQSGTCLVCLIQGMYLVKTKDYENIFIIGNLYVHIASLARDQ